MKYEKPEMEFIMFEEKDVITGSTGTGTMINGGTGTGENENDGENLGFGGGQFN